MSSLPVRTLRPEIHSVLQKLRTKIQGYLLLHGVALVLVALCASFLGTLAFDWIHFQIRKLELPVAVRVVLAIVVLGGICWVLANWVVLRLLSSKKSHGLALILERRFPGLNDRLITAVEFSDGHEHYSHTPLSEAMVDHTVSSAASSTNEIELGDVFDWKPLIVSWVVALVMVGGTTAIVAASPQSLERWKRAFVYFDEVYWVRETKLEVVVLAEPGDRPRPFVDGVYLHPRGAELKLLVTVPDGERPLGGKWVLPETVEIEYEFEQGNEYLIATVSSRLQSLLELQLALNEETTLLDKSSQGESDPQELARREEEIAREAVRAFSLLKAEGPSIAFSESEARFLKMHALQLAVNNETIDLEGIPDDEQVKSIARNQEQIIEEAKATLGLLKSELDSGHSAHILTLLQADMKNVAERLNQAKIDEKTQAIQQRILGGLSEIFDRSQAAALEKVRSQATDIVVCLNESQTGAHTQALQSELLNSLKKFSDLVAKEKDNTGNRWQSREGDTKLLARRGEGEFQFKLPSVLNGIQFWISGNDYINRTPYRVVIVDPPQAESVSLNCDYADYTRLDLEGLDQRSLNDEQIDVPLETWFELDIRTNKPLRNATVQAGPYEFTLGQFSDQKVDTARLRTYDSGGESDTAESLPPEFIQAALSQDRLSISLPFILSTHSQKEIDERGANRLPEKWSKPWILPPDSQVKIYLEDTDGILSAEPLKFAIRGQIDQPPEIDSEKYGIGTAITRKASIPIKGFITDDYGIDVAVFQFKVDDATEFRTRSFRNRPEDFPLEFRLQGSEEEIYERFEVLPTDLVEGQKLTLTVYARDGDNLNGPHESRSKEYTFKIVTADELLGLLYEREINLRRQFEQIISEVERTRKDLLDHRLMTGELAQLKASNSRTIEQDNRLEEIEVALTNAAERSLFQIGKNRADTAAVLDTFENILEELVNNGVHTRQMTASLNQSILAPLRLIVSGPPPVTDQADYDQFAGNFPDADSLVGLFRQAMEEELDPEARIDASTKEISMMLVRMRGVLSEMAELAELHEAIAELKEISDDFEELRKKTIEERKNSLKNKLKDL